jgi:SAM-dependent methyltransferase
MKTDRIETIRDNYNRIADEYAQRLFHELEGKPLDRELLRRFAASVGERGDVCDIGCGPGQVARCLHDEGASVFGLDLSPGMVEQARRLNPEIEFREGNMLALDLPDGGLAGIASFYGIVNLPRETLPAAFGEMARVLAPSGLLLLAFHIGNEVLRPEELWGRAVSMEFFHFQPEVIRHLLGEAGLVIDEAIERAPYAPDVEYQSRRMYLFAHKPDETGG